MKIKLAVLFGGKSVEHEISVISAIQAIKSLNTDKYDVIPIYMTKQNEMYIGKDIDDIEKYKDIKSLVSNAQRIIMVNDNNRIMLMPYPAKLFSSKAGIEVDIVFPIVHGTNVEDGGLQGYLKTVGVAFVGCDVTASAMGMDKYFSKLVLKDNGIPVLDCLCFKMSDYSDMDLLVSQVEAKFNYPVIVKPYNLGSSVGITVANDKDALVKAIDDAFLYSRRVLVEPAIVKLREINCAVLGDENEAIASECEEPMHSKDILSYEDKYMSSSKNGASKGMAGVSRKIPADISDDKKQMIRDIAIKAFQVLGCNGVARIDFLLDDDNGNVYLNELNTIPGSLSFYLWEPIGIKYSELLDRMIELSFKRRREDEALTFSFDTNILNSASLKGLKGGKMK